MPEPRDVIEIAEERRTRLSGDHARWNELSKAYRGLYKDLAPGEFRSDERIKTANFLKHSWDLFSNSVGKVPDIHVAPLTLKQKSKADQQEKVCFAYNEVWGMKRKMRVLAHYFVGMGAVGIGVLPDYNRKFPMLLVEDPRNVFPGPAYSSTSTAASASGVTPMDLPMDAGGMLDDCVVIKRLTGRQINQLFPGKVSFLEKELREYHEVYYYYDSENMSVTLGKNKQWLQDPVPHGAPWCPWQFPTTFAPDMPVGSSMFEQQIGLQLAFMRLLDQKLALNDAVVWPWIFTKGWVEIDPDQRLIKGGDADSNVQMISPPAEFQVDRDMAALRDLMRTLNFENEATQGNLQGGPITGRGLVELSRATVETVQSFFDDLAFVLPKIYTTAMLIDRNEFGDTKKMLAGKGKGETFFEEYRPKDVLNKIGSVAVEFGPGLGGFEGFVQLLQGIGAEMVSLETAMEHAPFIRSVADEQRRVLKEKVLRVMYDQALLGQAAVSFEYLAGLLEVLESGGDHVKYIREHPPQQNTLTPETVGPVPPELAAMQGGPPPPLEELLGGVA